MFLMFFFLFCYYTPRQTFDDGSATRLTRRKLLKTATGLGVDYSVYNPVAALGGTHLASLLTDVNTVATINSILEETHPTAVVLIPVTTTRRGGGGFGVGGSNNNTNSPTHSPASEIFVSTSTTSSKNFDNYVFIGAGVLGGIMLLGMGGGGLYYLKKRKEYRKKMQNNQNGIILVVKPPVLPYEQPNSSAFSIRRNVAVVPINNNDDDNNDFNKATSRVDDDDGAMHAKVDEYNLWGDLDIEASVSPSPNSKSPAYTPSYSGAVTPSLDIKKPGPTPHDLQSALSRMFGKVMHSFID